MTTPKYSISQVTEPISSKDKSSVKQPLKTSVIKLFNLAQALMMTNLPSDGSPFLKHERSGTVLIQFESLSEERHGFPRGCASFP